MSGDTAGDGESHYDWFDLQENFGQKEQVPLDDIQAAHFNKWHIGLCKDYGVTY